MSTYLGPLTTAWVPPSSCYDLTVSSSEYTEWVTEDVTDSAGDSISETTYRSSATEEYLQIFDYTLDSGCYPTGSPGKSMVTDAYYSPGVCPESWYHARQSVSAGDTIIDCCPTGYEIGNTLCMTEINSGEQPVVLFLNGEREDETPTLSRLSAQTIYATGIQVRFRDGDFDESSVSSAPTSQGTKTEEAGKGDETNGSVIAPSGTNTPLPETGGGGGLSTGAKIGLGVGIPLGVLLIAAVAFIIFWRRRRANAAAAGPAVGPEGSPSAGQAYPSDPNNQYAGMAQTYPADPSKQFVSAAAAPVATTGHYNQEQKAAEMYAPGAHGPTQNQHAMSEMSGTPAGYAPYSHGNPAVHSASVSPNSPPAQPAYALQASYGGGPVPEPAELYPETIQDNRRAS